MPNWCYTQVCFKGKPENIIRLSEDIKKSMEWYYENNYNFCNVRYLLSLSNFDTVSYLERYYPSYFALIPNFRGSAFNTNCIIEECDDGDLLYYPYFEMAWNTDYELLQIISMNYNVEFSAYSEECGMGIRHTCRNCDMDIYNFDRVIIPNYEQLEEFNESNNYSLDIDYTNAVKKGSDDEKELLYTLKSSNIEYNTEIIPSADVPDIYGIYYDYIYGVDYDDGRYRLSKYPGIDRFNRIAYMNGIIYDK